MGIVRGARSGASLGVMRRTRRIVAPAPRTVEHAERVLVEMCQSGHERQAVELAKELLRSRGDRFAAAVFRAAAAGGLDALAASARRAARARRGEVAFAAVYALGRLRAEGSLATLMDVLRSRRRSPRLRAMAAEALGELGDARAEGVLLESLREGPAEVRFFAAFALGSLGSERSKAALTALARDDTDVVRRYGSVAKEARRALRRIALRRKRGPTWTRS